MVSLRRIFSVRKKEKKWAATPTEDEESASLFSARSTNATDLDTSLETSLPPSTPPSKLCVHNAAAGDGQPPGVINRQTPDDLLRQQKQAADGRSGKMICRKWSSRAQARLELVRWRSNANIKDEHAVLVREDDQDDYLFSTSKSHLTIATSSSPTPSSLGLLLQQPVSPVPVRSVDTNKSTPQRKTTNTNKPTTMLQPPQFFDESYFKPAAATSTKSKQQGTTAGPDRRGPPAKLPRRPPNVVRRHNSNFSRDDSDKDGYESILDRSSKSETPSSLDTWLDDPCGAMTNFCGVVEGPRKSSSHAY